MPNDFANYNNENIESNLLATQTSAGLLSAEDKTKLDELYDIITYTLNVNTLPPNTYINTNIDSSILLVAGVYLVQVYTDSHDSTNLWQMGYTGIMYWDPSEVSVYDQCNIQLHYSGHARNNGILSLKTQAYSIGSSCQIALAFRKYSSGGPPTAVSNVSFTFKFKLMIPSIY